METVSPKGALRRLERRLFPIGEPLPGCVYDDAGRALVRAGVTLDEDQFENLMRVARRGVFVGTDWPAVQASPDEAAELSFTMKAVLAGADEAKGVEAR